MRTVTTACLLGFFLSSEETPERRTWAAFDELTGRATACAWPLMNMFRSFVEVTSVRILEGVRTVDLTCDERCRVWAVGLIFTSMVKAKSLNVGSRVRVR